MKYENTKEYPCGKFRRMRGMKRKTFEKAAEILNAKYAAERAKNVRKSGRKPKLGTEDKLLATLECLWEYRTMAAYRGQLRHSGKQHPCDNQMGGKHPCQGRDFQPARKKGAAERPGRL